MKFSLTFFCLVCSVFHLLFVVSFNFYRFIRQGKNLFNTRYHCCILISHALLVIDQTSPKDFWQIFTVNVSTKMFECDKNVVRCSYSMKIQNAIVLKRQIDLMLFSQTRYSIRVECRLLFFFFLVCSYILMENAGEATTTTKNTITTTK